MTNLNLRDSQETDIAMIVGKACGAIVTPEGVQETTMLLWILNVIFQTIAENDRTACIDAVSQND